MVERGGVGSIRPERLPASVLGDIARYVRSDRPRHDRLVCTGPSRTATTEVGPRSTYQRFFFLSPGFGPPLGFLAPLLLPGPLSPTRYLPIGQGVVELILRCVPCEHQSVFRVVTDPRDASIVHLVDEARR